MISLALSILLSLSPGSHENIVLTSTRGDTLWITTQTEGSVRTAHLDWMPPFAWSPITVTRTDTGRVARVMVRVTNRKGWDSSVIVVVYPIVSGVFDHNGGLPERVSARTHGPAYNLTGRRISGVPASGVIVGRNQLQIIVR